MSSVTWDNKGDWIWAHDMPTGDGVAVVMTSKNLPEEIPSEVLNEAALRLSDDLMQVTDCGSIPDLSLLWARLDISKNAEQEHCGHSNINKRRPGLHECPDCLLVCKSELEIGEDVDTTSPFFKYVAEEDN